MKEIKDDTNKWKDIPCSWVRRSNIVKMTILYKVINKFSTIPINLSIIFVTELEKIISQFVWKHKRPPIGKLSWEKKNNGAEGIRCLDFRLYYKAIVIKTVWYWHQNKNIDKWKKIERWEINPNTCGHLIFDKEY